MRLKKFSLAIPFCLSMFCFAVGAQTTEKTIFVASGEGPDNATVARAVSAISDELRAANHHLASSPATTQAIFTVACLNQTTAPSGQVHLDHIVRLVLTLPGQSTPIWTAQENGPYPVFQMGGDGAKWGKNFSKVAAKLISDLKAAQQNGTVPVDL